MAYWAIRAGQLSLTADIQPISATAPVRDPEVIHLRRGVPLERVAITIVVRSPSITGVTVSGSTLAANR